MATLRMGFGGWALLISTMVLAIVVVYGAHADVVAHRPHGDRRLEAVEQVRTSVEPVELGLLGQSCGHHVIAQDGTIVRDYERCDPEFDGCFTACGSVFARIVTPLDDTSQARATVAAAACADECDRHYTR